MPELVTHCKWIIHGLEFCDFYKKAGIQWPFTVDLQVRSQADTCGIYGGQLGSETSFPVLRLSPVSNISVVFGAI